MCKDNDGKVRKKAPCGLVRKGLIVFLPLQGGQEGAFTAEP